MGKALGKALGKLVGNEDGFEEGSLEGHLLGCDVGRHVGCEDGCNVGFTMTVRIMGFTSPHENPVRCKTSSIAFNIVTFRSKFDNTVAFTANPST